MQTKRTILVTGGAGYIGSHTTHELLRRGFDVVVYDSLEKGHAQSLPKEAKLIIGSTADIKKLERAIENYRPSAVMHFAAYAEVGESAVNPRKYYKNNLLNSINLTKVMLKLGMNKLIFSSTAAVYGQPKTTPITEDAEKEPINNYGISKYCFEEYLKSCEKITSITLRYFNAAGAAYGIGEDHNPETHLIPLAIKATLNQEEMKIFGKDYETPDGTCIRDYVHVLDIADAHIRALQILLKVDKGSGGIEHYNLGTGKGNSVLEVIDTTEKVTGKKIPRIFCERRQGDPAVLVASYDKIKRDLGWEPRRNLEEIITSAHEWHLKNPNGFSR